VRRALSTLLVAALLGCGSDPVAPKPDGGTGGSAPDAGTGGAPPDAGPVRRTVTQRNPFGNVAETENLLWDGDFEWFSAFSDEYGWLAGSSPQSIGYSFSDVRLGAVCRSGLKCAGVKNKHIIVGIAVASQGHKIEASFWAHLTKGTCDQVTALVADLGEGADPDVTVTPVDKAPDAAGWCQFDTVVDARAAKSYLYIDNGTGADLVVDDAVIKKVDSMMSVKAWHGPITGALFADLDAARAAVRRLRGPHDAPPSPARKAFEQWRKR
jgi:hypothetical protein